MTRGLSRFFVALLSLCLLLQGCSDEYLDTTDKYPFNEQVCGGGVEDSYFPLAIGNTWKYGQNNTYDPITRIVESTVPYINNTYFIVVDEQNTDDITMFLRKDSLGNIMQFRGSEEFLYIPADPEVGDTWENTGDSLSVSSVNATLTTTYCDYRNVLVVEERNRFGTLENTRYYVKGIGEVYSTTEKDTTNRTLLDITLE